MAEVTVVSSSSAGGGSGGEQQQQRRERRKLARALLTCFSAPAFSSSSSSSSYSSTNSRRRTTQPLSRSVSAATTTDADDDDDDDVAEEDEGITATRRRVSFSSRVVEKQPLRRIAEAFKDLANVVSSEEEEDVEVAAFSRACSYVGTLFGCIGFHFKFIEMDYLTKVNDIAEASKSFQTLGSMVDKDMETNTVRKQGSHSRNLLKIKRGLDFLRLLFHQVLLTEGNSIRDAVQKAYTQIFQTHHGWALRKAVSSRVHHIPTKLQLFRKINEDESEARVLMQAYITASPPLLQYIDNIFISRNLGIDW